MRTLRYLLSLIAILSVVSVSAATFGQPHQTQRRGILYAQTPIQMPSVAMSSTGSAMMQSGTVLPMAAVSGTTTAEENAPNRRRAKKDGPDIEIVVPPIVDIPDPEALVPIGDAAVPMMLMAMLFAGVIYTRRKKALKG